MPAATCNLYVVHRGRQTAGSAEAHREALASEDARLGQPAEPRLGEVDLARVSPNGGYLAFMSEPA